MKRRREDILVPTVPGMSGLEPVDARSAYISRELREVFSDLQDLSQFKFTYNDQVLNKVVKDKEKKAAAQKKARAQLEQLKRNDSETEDAGVNEERNNCKEDSEVAKRVIKAEAGPPVFRRSLFPVEAPGEQLEFSEDNSLVAACKELLGAEAGFVDGPTMARELLLGGWLRSHCLQQQTCTAETAKKLLDLIAKSPDIQVAQSAYKVLASVLGDQLGSNRPLGRQDTLPAESPLYAPVASSCSVDWVPSDSAFLDCLRALGYRNPLSGAQSVKASAKRSRKAYKSGTENDAEAAEGGARRGKHSAKGAAATKTDSAEDAAAKEDEDMEASKEAAGGKEWPDLAGWEKGAAPPRLGNLQLLLRLLTVVSQRQASGSSTSMSPGGLASLLLAVLQLRLDPACNILALDLQAAAQALIEAFEDGDWARKFPDIASQIAALGGSHRGGLEAIKLIPGSSERAELLRSHAAAILLSSLLQTKGKKGTISPPKRGAPAPVDLEKAIAGQPWFEGGEGALKVAKSVKQGTYTTWDLCTAIELADILIWPHTKRARESGEESGLETFIGRWHHFCQKLGSHMPKDAQGAAVRLLITTIITRDNPDSGM